MDFEREIAGDRGTIQNFEIGKTIKIQPPGWKQKLFMSQRYTEPPVGSTGDFDRYPWHFSLSKITNYGFFLAISAACLIGHGVVFSNHHKTWQGVQGLIGVAFMAWTWKYYRVYAHDRWGSIKPHGTLTGVVAYGAMTIAFITLHYYWYSRKKSQKAVLGAREPVDRVINHE
eukprot:jgi/Mesvir1/29501/Mv06999-RA.1